MTPDRRARNVQKVFSALMDLQDDDHRIPARTLRRYAELAVDVVADETEPVIPKAIARRWDAAAGYLERMNPGRYRRH